MERTWAQRQEILVLPLDADPALLDELTQLEYLQLVPPDSVRALLTAAAVSDTLFDRATVDRLFDGAPADISDSVKTPIYYKAIAEKWVRAILEAPVDLHAVIGSADSSTFGVYADEADINSEAAGDHLTEWVEGLRDSQVVQALAGLGVDRQILTPFAWHTSDVAPMQKKSGLMLALFLPYFLIILTMSGGMYPSLDITAGEKERHTLEALLAAPVSRWEIAIGKFLTVFTAGLVSMLLAILSMSLSTKMGGGGFGESAGNLPFGLTVTSVLWIVFLMVPMAVLFSSLLITVSISARTFKEGQSYVTPLLMLVIVPAMITFVPGIELTWPLSVVPVVNLCLALKDVLTGVHSVPMILAVFGSTIVYAAFMLFVTSRIFDRESVLFRT